MFSQNSYLPIFAIWFNSLSHCFLSIFSGTFLHCLNFLWLKRWNLFYFCMESLFRLSKATPNYNICLSAKLISPKREQTFKNSSPELIYERSCRANPFSSNLYYTFVKETVTPDLGLLPENQKIYFSHPTSL